MPHYTQQYLVNDELVTISTDGASSHPTASQVKACIPGAQPGDDLYATLPTGDVLYVRDNETIPAGAQDFQLVPKHERGSLLPRLGTLA